jgi:hypothetical protein
MNNNAKQNGGKRIPNKNNRSKNRQRTRKFETKGKDEEVIEKRPGGNDVRWWGTPDFVKAVAQFNFSNPLGKPIPYTFYNDPLSQVQYRTASYSYTTAPGVMAIDVLPTIGIATNATDAVNTFVRSVYTKLRSTNNQSAPYQAPDLGMYMLAIDSVHMMIEQLIRVYGAARTYSPMNRYLPKALITAMGVNPDASEYPLYSNLADFRAEILNLLLKIQTLAMPVGMHLNERHRELVKYVYSDGQTNKAQSYLFRTKYLYQYDEAGDPNGGRLVANPVPIGSSVAAWISMAHAMIDALTQSQFFAIVSGDIIKAFGYDKLFIMPYFDEVYSVAPVYNPEMLLEIHNMRLAGDRFNDSAFNVTQNPNAVEMLAAPYTKCAAAPVGAIFPVVDVPIENPDPDTVMIATRLVHAGTVGKDGDVFKYIPSSLGSELPLDIVIYFYKADGTLGSVQSDSNTFTGGALSSVYSLESFFDWHPIAYAYSVGSSADDIVLQGMMGDIQNYTVMSPGDIQRMHDMAIYGALTLVDVDTVGMPK